MRSLVVVPTFNEAGNIQSIIRAICSAGSDIDVLVIDDGSPDGTALLAKEVAGLLEGVTVLRRERKLGLGSAYRDGFRWAADRGYDIVIEMDADFSHDPTDLPRLIDAVKQDGADLVIGSRYASGGSIPEWSWYRRALSRWGNAYARVALAIDVADMTAGFRAYRADILAKVPLELVRTDGYGFQIEMVREVVRASGKVVEIPICFSERTRGRSKMSSLIVVEALVAVTKWGLSDRLRRGWGFEALRRRLVSRKSPSAEIRFGPCRKSIDG